MPRPDRPWQVIRMNHSGTVTIVRTCRTELAADLLAWVLDTRAVIAHRGATPHYHYDTRRTLSGARP